MYLSSMQKKGINQILSDQNNRLISIKQIMIFSDFPFFCIETTQFHLISIVYGKKGN